MKYIYRVLNHNAEQATLQVKLSCVDVTNSGVRDIPYPIHMGVPDLTPGKIMEQVLIHFRGELDNWEMLENNKDKYEEVKAEAEALIGKTQAFDHSILDDGWLIDELE
tara:strand:+ start:979 stop:1302 length:324 start_codon:yes stop_codon:yes gene_type:complete